VEQPEVIDSLERAIRSSKDLLEQVIHPPAPQGLYLAWYAQQILANQIIILKHIQETK